MDRSDRHPRVLKHEVGVVFTGSERIYRDWEWQALPARPSDNSQIEDGRGRDFSPPGISAKKIRLNCSGNPGGSTVLNLAAAFPLSGCARGAKDADCGSPQRSSQINVDQDELNLVLPEAITSVRRGTAAALSFAETMHGSSHAWEFAWQTITLSYRMTNGLKRVLRFWPSKSSSPGCLIVGALQGCRR
jgi:hypothetical protein